jgi:hypothetical protein
MENFKEIADKCLAGKLSGTFVLRNGKIFYSKTHLSATSFYALPYCIAGWCYSVVGNCYSKNLSIRDNDVIDFIPDNMQKQIKIDIPEGKVPVMEQTEKGVVITWKEEELTSDIIESKLDCCIPSFKFLPNLTSIPFYNKVEVLRKLTNIRNYFGKPDGTESGFYIYRFDKNEFKVATTAYPAIYAGDVVAFAKREHAQAAIKILGDELKCLFEPW